MDENNIKTPYIPAEPSVPAQCAFVTVPVRTDLLLPYNLQFFGDGPGGEKTEAPTEKRISDTRKKGQVAKSQELASSFELIGIFLMLRLFGTLTKNRFLEVFNWAWGDAVDQMMLSDRGGVTTEGAMQLFATSTYEFVMAVLPYFIGGFLIAFLSNALQFKFQISTEPLKPSLDKFNPIEGFKRMFNVQALFRLLLSIVKIVLIGAIAYSVLAGHINEIFILYEMPLMQAVSLVLDIVIDLGLRISLVYLIVGFADFFFQRWKFNQNLKMTKQEVKDEFKDQEGDPEIKGKQRQRMREASQRRMMKNVPQADVVITNPTHIAVAIQYEAEKGGAPVVVAKGEEYLAQRIKETAKENDVPIIENKPLARAIYTTVDIDQEIPPELYKAVAEVLAMVYQMKRKTPQRKE